MRAPLKKNLCYALELPYFPDCQDENVVDFSKELYRRLAIIRAERQKNPVIPVEGLKLGQHLDYLEFLEPEELAKVASLNDFELAIDKEIDPIKLYRYYRWLRFYSEAPFSGRACLDKSEAWY